MWVEWVAAGSAIAILIIHGVRCVHRDGGISALWFIHDLGALYFPV